MSTPELWAKSVKLVTPELAMLWLTSWNAANYRRPSAATVRSYAVADRERR